MHTLDEYQWFVSSNVIFQPSKEQMPSYVRHWNYFLERYDWEQYWKLNLKILPISTCICNGHCWLKSVKWALRGNLKILLFKSPLKTTIYFKYEKILFMQQLNFNYKQLVLSTNVEEKSFARSWRPDYSLIVNQEMNV